MGRHSAEPNLAESSKMSNVPPRRLESADPRSTLTSSEKTAGDGDGDEDADGAVRTWGKMEDRSTTSATISFRFFPLDAGAL